VTSRNLKHKVNGILVTVLIVSGVNLLINVIYPYPGFLSFLTLLLFFLNDFSVRTKGNYGFIFSFASHLVGFAHLQTGWDRIQYSGLILLGGLFYLIVSLIFFYIRPRYAANCRCIKLTSKYLQLRTYGN
jgi:hypothetical protein